MAALRTVLVIMLLFTSAFFVLSPNENVIRVAEGWATSGGPATYNMTTLWQAAGGNSAGVIFKQNTSNYIFLRSVTISSGDTLQINDTFNNLAELTLTFEKGVSLYIDGTFNCVGTEFYWVNLIKVPISQRWGGVHFNASSSGGIYNTTISGAYTGLYINGSSPVIRGAIIHDNVYGVDINDNAAPVFGDCRINNSNFDGISCKDSTITITDRTNITTNGRHGLILRHSGAFINNSDIDNNTGQGIWMVNSTDITIENASFVKRNGQDLVTTGGIYAENSSFTLNNSFVMNNKLTGINLTENSSATINNSILFRNRATGIYLNWSTADIKGLNVTNSSTGIFIDTKSSLDATNVSIHKSLHKGFYIKHAHDVIINDCTITTDPPAYMNNKGILVNHSTAVVLNNVTISSSSIYGLQIYNSSLNATNITIKNVDIHSVQVEYGRDIYLRNFTTNPAFSSDTIHLRNSENVNILGNSKISTDSYFVIFVQNTTLTVENATVTYGSGNSMNLSVDSVVVLINTTMPDDTVIFQSNDTSDVTRYWYFCINVTTPGGTPIPGARVNVSDAQNNTLYSKITPLFGYYHGRVWWLKMYESVQNNTGIFYNNTYWVEASVTGRKDNYTQVNAVKHHWIPLWLWVNRAPGNVTNFQPLSTHDNTPNGTWNTTTDPDGDKVYYHLVVSDGKKDVLDVITENNWWNQTTPISYGVYTVNLSAMDESGLEGNISQYVLDIHNSKPTTPVITLEPTSPHTGHNLIMNITAPSTDADYDPVNYTELVRYTVKWFKDGVEQTGLEKKNKTLGEVNHTTISATLTSIGNVWRVKVTPYDGHNDSWQTTGDYGAHSNGTPVSLQVTIGNRGPYVANPITNDHLYILEDNSDTTSVNVQTIFDDDDLAVDATEQLTYSFSGNTQIAVVINSGTGAVTLTPAADFAGSENITFTATDKSSAQANYVLWVEVQNTNDLPVMDAIGAQTAWEDQLYAVYFHANDTKDPWDASGLIFSANFSDAITGLTPTVADTTYGKKYSFTPDNSMVGNYTIRFTVSDPSGGSVYEDVAFEIINTNDAPDTPVITAPADDSTYVEKTEITFTGTGTDDDEIYGDILTFSWHSNKDGLMGYGKSLKTSSLTVNTHTITLKVWDGEEESSVSITVTIEEEEVQVVPTASLVKPANGSPVNQLYVDLEWTSTHELAASFSYSLYIDTAKVPRTLAPKQTGLTVTTINYSGLEDGKTYYWQIVPYYGTVEGPPTGIRHFTVDLIYIRPQATCTLVAPTHESTSASTKVEFKWTTTHENKDDFTYKLYVDTSQFYPDSLPSSPLVKDLSSTTMQYTATLEDLTTYWWTVIPYDTVDSKDGICASSPPVWNVEVDTGGGKEDVTVNLKSPEDNGKVGETSVKLEWKSDDANKDKYTYKVYLSINSNPTSDLPVFTGLNKFEYTYDKLEDGKTYYWTVIPNYNDDGVCLDGIWKFEVDLGWEEKREINITGGEDVTLKQGETQTVTLTVENAGNVPLTLNIDLDTAGLSGITADKSSVTIEPESDATVTVTVNVPSDAPAGTYTIKLSVTPDDAETPLASEEFTVTVEKPEKKDEEEKSNAAVIGAGIAIVIVVVLIILFLLMKRKKEVGEEKKEGEERKEMETPKRPGPPAGGTGPGSQAGAPAPGTGPSPPAGGQTPPAGGQTPPSTP